MFIRSQCREILINTDCITIENEGSKKTSIFAIKEGKMVFLASYKTKDRAKEVLDMICDLIEDGPELIEEDSDSKQSIIRNCIFEMPII